MVKVCLEDFPETEGFYMDGFLKENIDPLVKNVKKDWDFVILISGEGMVRVGKSVFGMQIGYYINSQVNKVYNKKNSFNFWNYCWKGAELKEKAHQLAKKPYSILIYDEAGGELQGKKILEKITKNLIDFLRECGQLNLFILVILPDFFDLPKGIALTRSVCLFDVYCTGEFERGYFKFFSRKRKKKLYLKGKKELDYDIVKPNFVGRFTNFYPLDEKEYRKLKKISLKKSEEEDNHHIKRFKLQRDALMTYIYKIHKVPPEKIAELFNVYNLESMSPFTIGDTIRKFQERIKEEEDFRVRMLIEQTKEDYPEY